MHTAYTARTTVGICQFVNGIYEQLFRTAVPVRAPTNIRGVYMDKKTNIKDIISMAGGLEWTQTLRIFLPLTCTWIS